MSTVTVQQAFELALRHHQAGQLAEAEALYRQILAVQPNHAEALHLLGVLACQFGRHDFAVKLIEQAVAFSPHNATMHSNLGEAYRGARQWGAAVAAFRQARQLSPDDPTIYSNLANALRESGEKEEAIATCHHALWLKPDYAEAYSNLGAALADLGKFAEACDAYERALRLKPDFAIAHFNLGHALGQRGLIEEAIAAYRGAIQFQPDHPEACNNLGQALREQGQIDEAIAAYRQAIHFHPDHFEAHNNLGIVLVEQGQIEAGVLEYRRALQLNPDRPEILMNLSNALRHQGRPDEAMIACREALRVRPGYPDAHINLGNVFKDQGQLDEAIAAYRRALEWEPGNVSAQSNLIYALHFHPREDKGAIVEEQEHWNRRFSDPQRCFVQPYGNDRSPERRLRIGYVSADFRDHVIGRNLMPLLRNHDRQKVEIFCYSGVVKPDAWMEEFRRCAQQWRNTVGIGDEALADLIRQDGVDVLVDLAQHLEGNRLPVFAYQPAPVQVSFAGYPASTGLEAIPYRISDRYLEAEVSAEFRPVGKEQVMRIDSFWCYDSGAMKAVPGELPAKKRGRVTFGSLNNFCKVNEPLLKLWARVFGSVKDSRLVLLSHAGSHRQRTLETLALAGVEARRVEFVEPRPRRDYLELYHRIDIALDPFPYNGHTTSLDALWMGVPVVSLVGQRAVSRAGLSQLTNLGLPELVAHSEDEYVEIATRLAGDLPRLTEQRATLRPRMEASVLMDAPRFARQIEAAYRTMWRQWCAKGESR